MRAIELEHGALGELAAAQANFNERRNAVAAQLSSLYPPALTEQEATAVRTQLEELHTVKETRKAADKAKEKAARKARAAAKKKGAEKGPRSPSAARTAIGNNREALENELGITRAAKRRH